MDRRQFGRMVGFIFVACSFAGARALGHDGKHHGRVQQKRSYRLSSPPDEITQIEKSRPSRFSLGLFASQNLALSSTANPPALSPHKAGDNHNPLDGHDHHHAVPHAAVAVDRQPDHAGEDHSGGSPGFATEGNSAISNGLSPVITLKAGYQVTSDFAFIAQASSDFITGLRDPAVGGGLIIPFASKYMGLLTLTGSIPVSKSSQDLSKATSVALALSTLYQENAFFMGVGASIVGSFYYGPAVAPIAVGSGPTASVSREVNRNNINLFIGTMFTDQVSGSVGAGLTNTFNESAGVGWATDITLARLGYSHKGFLVGAAFSLISSSPNATAISLPTRPYVGFNLQYVFGNLSTLGIITSN